VETYVPVSGNLFPFAFLLCLLT